MAAGLWYRGKIQPVFVIFRFSEEITKISWISNPKFSLHTLIVLRVWQFGSPMIIFLAGLRQIPSELYESASIDGANTFAKFTRITLPILSPLYCLT